MSEQYLLKQIQMEAQNALDTGETWHPGDRVGSLTEALERIVMMCEGPLAVEETLLKHLMKRDPTLRLIEEFRQNLLDEAANHFETKAKGFPPSMG